jgi:hypothetical protein
MLKLTAVTTFTIKGRFQFAVPRNIFDIELENASTRETETDLETGHESGSQPRNGRGAVGNISDSIRRLSADAGRSKIVQ